MHLRAELTPRPVDPAVRDRLTAVIGRVVTALEVGDPVDAPMREHDALAGRHDIPALRYQELHASMGDDEAATEALLGPAPVVPDITREELVEVARRVLDLSITDETSCWLDLFERNTPARGTSDLFCWPDPEWLARIGTDEPSPEQIVDEALRPTRNPAAEVANRENPR